MVSPYARPLKTQGAEGRVAHAVVKLSRGAEREYRMLRAATHARVVHADHAPGMLIMPAADTDLLALVQAGPLEPKRAWRLLADLRDAVFAIHTRGIVHRDVKLENVLVYGDRAKLGDFGYATFLKRGETLTETRGTPGYVAPEIMRREPYDHKVDVFSFGVCCFAACTRQMPFDKRGPRARIPGIARLDALDLTDARRTAVESALRFSAADRASSLDLARLRLLGEPLRLEDRPGDQA
jgi:serine/threonine-protein kinase